MTVLVWAGVVVIGGCGAVLRFALDSTIGTIAGRAFPYGTFVINISGAAVLGVLIGLALPGDDALLAGTAAVGSYTTFSTWLWESQRLEEEREHRRAGLNIVASVLLGLGAAALGRWLATHA